MNACEPIQYQKCFLRRNLMRVTSLVMRPLAKPMRTVDFTDAVPSIALDARRRVNQPQKPNPHLTVYQWVVMR